MIDGDGVRLESLGAECGAASLRGDCASLAAAAFADSPLWSAIFAVPDVNDEGTAREERQKRLRRFYEKYFGILDLTSALQGFCGVDREKNVACTFIIRDMGRPLSLWQKLRAGLMSLPFEIGFQQTMRLLRCGDVIENEMARAMGGRQMCSLERMCVDPANQGRGIGSRLLLEALDHGIFKALPCVLTTQEDRNVRFYERLGFKVVSEKILDFGDGVRNWTMVREPTCVET
jgi:GNAT superfamily N-acetyltransferase